MTCPSTAAPATNDPITEHGWTPTSTHHRARLDPHLHPSSSKASTSPPMTPSSPKSNNTPKKPSHRKHTTTRCASTTGVNPSPLLFPTPIIPNTYLQVLNKKATTI